MNSWYRCKKIIWYGIMIIMIYCSVLAVANPAQAAVKSQFFDVDSNDANALYINFLANRGIINGYTDGGYHPEAGLTRAQAATVIVKTASLPLEPSLTSNFIDVSNKHWGKAYIAAAAKAGYITGYPDKSFHPEEQITRAEAISLILRLSKQPLTEAKLPALSDINSDHWAASAVAVGIASGMVGISQDGKQYLPDAPFTRIDLAHALGILLTHDPELYTAPLEGKLKVREGSVSIQTAGSGNPIEVKTESMIKAGDIITTQAQSSAELSYADGSSILIKENTRISVTESNGRKYIKNDGSEGIAIDWLNIKIEQGIMIAGLATKYEASNTEQPGNNKNTGQVYQVGRQLTASLNGGANTNNQPLPWYEPSQTKKVKIRVDMPWGVAAIRGTFAMINVSTSGQSSVSCLTGDVEISNGGLTVPLRANQSTQVIQQNAVPQAPVPIPPEAIEKFVQEQQWIEQTAQAIEKNQEAAAPPPPQASQSWLGLPNAPMPMTPDIPSSILDTVKHAIQQIEPAPKPATSGGNFETSNVSHVANITLTKSSLDLGINNPVKEISRAELCKFLVESFALYDNSATSNFADVPVNNRYYHYVSSAFKAGLVTGYPDGTFKPNKIITRAEYAAVITRYLGYTDNMVREISRAELCKYVVDSYSLYDNSATSNFSDVASSVYNQHIASAVKAGLVSGYPDGTFKPDQVVTRDEYVGFVARFVAFTNNNTVKKITRAELCKLIVESFALNDDSITSYFTDVPANNIYYPYISSAVKAGIIGGYPDGTFKPDDFIDRDGFIVILTRFLGFTNNYNQTAAIDIAGSWAEECIIKALNSGIMCLYPDNSFKPQEAMVMNPDGQLITKINPPNASNKSIIWTSSNDSIASVDQNGQVTGKKEGTAAILATTADGNETASCTVNVKKITSITLSKSSMQLGINNPVKQITRAELCKYLVESFALYDNSATSTLTDVSSSVYNQYIATAVNAGLITGYPDGTFKPDNVVTRAEFATIVTRFLGYSNNQVETAATDIASHAARDYIIEALHSGIMCLEPDKTFLPDNPILMDPDGKLIAIINPPNAANKIIVWTSSDDSIASVDQGGLVTGKRAGSVVIYATTADGSKSASCTVTVIPPI